MIGKKKIMYLKCQYCNTWIPKKYLTHHERVCLVRRGLKSKPGEEKPGEIFTAKKGETIQELLDRIIKSKEVR